jgi:hypothetical protein
VKRILSAIYEFLESKTGFLIFGFLVTTVAGSFLNNEIQEKKSINDRAFELHRIRLTEAKALQQKILENSNSRSFYLHQVLAQLENPDEFERDAVSKFWDTNVEPTKDKWNKDLYYLHAQARVLFAPALADIVLVNKENLPTMRDQVLEKLDDETYKKTRPSSLHGAFVDAHATIYHLLRKCHKYRECERQKLEKLAEKQLNYLELVQSCLAYSLSNELLQNPYGPKAGESVTLPAQCVNYSKTSSS